MNRAHTDPPSAAIAVSDTAEALIKLIAEWPRGDDGFFIVESELESQVQSALTEAREAERERAAQTAENQWALMSSFSAVETERYTRAGVEIAAAIRADTQ